MQDRPTQRSRGELKAKHCWCGEVDLEQTVGLLLYLMKGAPIGIAADYKTHNKHSGGSARHTSGSMRAFVMSSPVT